MERQEHLRALEDASSDEEMRAHLQIAKWLRAFVEDTIPALLEQGAHILDSNGKDPDAEEYTDGGTEYMEGSSSGFDPVRELLEIDTDPTN